MPSNQHHADVSDSLSANRTALDVEFDKPIPGTPFTALRSMYVTDFNNDVARVAARVSGKKGWQEDTITSFKGGQITSLCAGRTAPSQHNASSPDMVFKDFR